MHVLHILLVVQAITLIEAADGEPETFKWTLHKSCYENTGSPDYDDYLERNIVWFVQTVKDWASNGAKKLDDSINGDQVTREAVEPLIGSDGYDDKAKDVRDKFKRLEKIEGPIGANGSNGRRYDKSHEWEALESSDWHYLNFRLVCRPEIERIVDKNGTTRFYSSINKAQVAENDFEVQWLDDEAAGKPPSLGMTAFVKQEKVYPPEGDRRHVAQTMNFEPIALKLLVDVHFNPWTPDLLASVLAPNAVEVAKQFDLTPVDSLHSSSFPAAIFHEMFHLNGIARMADDPAGAYYWDRNVRLKNRENPDLLSLIAFVIEYRHSDVLPFKVSQDGVVTLV